MFIDESIDSIFREEYPDVYCKMSSIKIHNDGVVETDDEVLSAVRKILMEVVDCYAFNADELECFVYNMYVFGVYMHITGKNPYRGEFNIGSLVGMALFRTRDMKERLTRPENLWDFCLEFVKTYSDWYYDSENKHGFNCEEKLINMFVSQVRSALEKKE